MGLLSPRTKTTHDHDHDHLLLMTDRFSKLNRSHSLELNTASVVASLFIENWVLVYRALFYMLTDKGPQFVVKFFDAVYSVLGGRTT